MSLSDSLRAVKYDVAAMPQPECAACKINYPNVDDDDEKSLSGLMTDDD